MVPYKIQHFSFVSVVTMMSVCALIWVARLLAWLWPLMIFLFDCKNFIGFQKFQNQNVFQVILRNFYFLDTPPPPPNEITSVLVWYKLRQKKNIRIITFFKIYWYLWFFWHILQNLQMYVCKFTDTSLKYVDYEKSVQIQKTSVNFEKNHL